MIKKLRLFLFHLRMLSFRKYGIHFYYADAAAEVVYLFPKFRLNGKKFYDVLAEQSFNSLRQIKNFWIYVNPLSDE